MAETRSRGPAQFRRELSAALSAGPNGRTPLRVAVLGRAGFAGAEGADAALADGLRAAGLTVTAVADPQSDVVVVLTPDARRASLPDRAICVAIVDDRVDEWLADPRFEDYDIVLVASEDQAATIGRRRSVVPVVGAPSPTALLDATRTWTDAPKVAIQIGPPTWDRAPTWGDTAFARGVQKAFRRRSWAATVHVREDAESEAATRADLALHIAGLAVPPVRDDQVSVLWLISHPDMVSAEQCSRYDVVFVASRSFRDVLAAVVERPVIALGQATDPDRFHPDPAGPAHEVLFVGNSRGARRPVLDALAGTTHQLAVYGGAWYPSLLDPRFLAGTWIPNEELHRYYSSAAIVLSDHWPDMRDEGFISNRVYDALASGAFVLSDHVVGIEAEFDDAVATYESPAEVNGLVDHYLEQSDERHDRAERGRAAVLARHTFDHRVEAILAAIAPWLQARDDQPIGSDAPAPVAVAASGR